MNVIPFDGALLACALALAEADAGAALELALLDALVDTAAPPPSPLEGLLHAATSASKAAMSEARFTRRAIAREA